MAQLNAIPSVILLVASAFAMWVAMWTTLGLAVVLGGLRLNEQTPAPLWCLASALGLEDLEEGSQWGVALCSCLALLVINGCVTVLGVVGAEPFNLALLCLFYLGEVMWVVWLVRYTRRHRSS